MNCYEYIAHNAGFNAVNLCKKYGFNIPINSDWQVISNCLQEIVNEYGENGLKEVMNLHPDKIILTELYSPIDYNGMYMQNAAMRSYGKAWFSSADGSGSLANIQPPQNMASDNKNSGEGFFKSAMLLQQNMLMILGFAALTAAILYKKS